ncbi:MAG: FAD-dependent thymidylate synthase [Deltaproteobacteria bacterium]|nr:MAG: FAD-dependent thymidylate synthase [Deltaproteobacteria bacterium]
MEIVKPWYKIRTKQHTIDDIMEGLEDAGRTCYKSEDKITPGSADKFIRKIIDLGHETVLEHAILSVRIVCDRGVTHEIVRHRLASYSQESTRYCDYQGAGIQFIHPLGLTEEQKIRRENHYMMVQKLYDQERDEGLSPQIARGILPNSLKTEIVMTCNLREWRHFFKLRAAAPAHPQMKELAIPMLTDFYKLLPVVFGDLMI